MHNCRAGKEGQRLPVPESMSNQVEPYPNSLPAAQRAVSRPPQARSARVPLRFAKHGSALGLRPQTSNHSIFGPFLR
jgi:hypothetical protein